MDYKNYIGPRKRAAIRRRRGKAVAMSVILLGCLVVSSPLVPRDIPEPTPTPKYSMQYMINVATMSPGAAKGFFEDYPELKTIIQ